MRSHCPRLSVLIYTLALGSPLEKLSGAHHLGSPRVCVGPWGLRHREFQGEGAAPHPRETGI